MTGLRQGHLVIIGGHEDREDDKVILKRFVDLCGVRAPRIVVLTAASAVPDEMWAIYDKAFGALGVEHRSTARIATRDDAGDEATAARIFEADGVFITGGDQKRLLALIGGTRVDHAIHRALRERGACIAGTSAGASAMSEHMLFDGSGDLLPQKGAVHLGAGLGFLHRVIVDQHFSERQRLGRLLSVVAQNPYLLGAGIDEDTALIVQPGAGIEVIGEGAVTLIDGREMRSNVADIKNHATLQLADVRLHLLPAGTRYGLSGGGGGDGNDGVQPLSRGLGDAIAAVAAVSAVAAVTANAARQPSRDPAADAPRAERST